MIWLKAWAAQLAAGALLLLSIGLFVAVLTAKGETRAQTKRADKAELATVFAKAETKMCQTDLAQVRAEADRQNAAVEALRAERDSAEARGRKALAAAQRASAATDRLIAEARTRKPQSTDYCEQARELEVILRGTVK